MKVEQVAAKPSKAVKAQKKAVEKAEEKSVKTPKAPAVKDCSQRGFREEGGG